MTEKRFKFRRLYVDIANINEIALYEIDNNPSDDLDESNLFYVYSTTDANVQDIVDKMNSQEERIQALENKLNQTALEFLNHETISMGKAVEISEMSYHDFIKYRAEHGNPMELQL